MITTKDEPALKKNNEWKGCTESQKERERESQVDRDLVVGVDRVCSSAQRMAEDG